MSIIAKSEGNPIPLLEEGVYTAVCTGLIDLGDQKNEKYEKISRKVQIVWTIPSEIIKYKDKDNNEVESARQLSKEYSLALGEKSNLRKDLTGWRGKAFTELELKGFDLKNILNVPCQLQVIHQGTDKKYCNVASIMGLPKGVKIETSELDNIFFDTTDRDTWHLYDKVPKFIQDKIKQAVSFPESELDIYLRGLIFPENATIDNAPTIQDDDLPF